MLDYTALWQCLDDLGLESWRSELEALIQARLNDEAHGDFAKWREAIEQLAANAEGEHRERRIFLMSLAPWRKGPFEVGGVTIDSEWRSDLKWDRLRPVVATLDGCNVLDIGCGNGYYALRMHDAGACRVIGIDPTLLHIMQYLAIRPFTRGQDVHLLPLRLHELPGPTRVFDKTFSMGVLYHQRSPLDHLRQLRDTLRPSGQLVLETLFLPGSEAFARTPEDRYARMRNVWLLPTISELMTWIARCGYRDAEILDASPTTTDEQRTTEWMPFESLAEALAPDDLSRTVEGWPAPRRVVVTATAP